MYAIVVKDENELLKIAKEKGLKIAAATSSAKELFEKKMEQFHHLHFVFPF